MADCVCLGGVFRSQPPVLRCLSVLPMWCGQVLCIPDLDYLDFILTVCNFGFSVLNCWLGSWTQLRPCPCEYSDQPWIVPCWTTFWIARLLAPLEGPFQFSNNQRRKKPRSLRSCLCFPDQSSGVTLNKTSKINLLTFFALLNVVT
ncbi:hypothetical protein ILYODFUR_026880, partial [Ilyodon furcidens]